jgi:hypothetical protein
LPTAAEPVDFLSFARSEGRLRLRTSLATASRN